MSYTVLPKKGLSRAQVEAAIAAAPYDLTAMVPAVAQGNEVITVAFRAPKAGTVTAVAYASQGGITGQNTHTRSVSLTDASGAEIAKLQFNSGVDAPTATARVITITGSEAAREVVAGEILLWWSSAIGSGLADPGGLAIVTIEPA